MQSADPGRDVSAFSHSHADGAVIGSNPGFTVSLEGRR